MKYIKNKISGDIAFMGNDEASLISLVENYKEQDGTTYNSSDWEILDKSEEDIFKLLEEQTQDNMSYVEKRKYEYASLEEQADMRYWDEMNGTTTWKDHISAIKAKYPKS